MRILHLLSQHPQSTGSGIYLRQVIGQAAAGGHENAMVAGVSASMTPQLAGIAAERCAFVRFGQGELDFPIPGMSDVMPYVSSTFNQLEGRRLIAYRQAFGNAISETVVDFRPDIIHSHHLWLLTALARELCPSLPMVASCHSTDLRQFRRCPELARMVLPACRRLDRVLALGPGQGKEIAEIYGIVGEKIDVVGAGFDDRLFYATAKKPPPPVEVLYAGKLSLAKGVDLLLGAFADLGRSDLHLHLAGSGAGPEEELCRHMADRCGGTITWHGQLSQNDLAALMRRCHLFVLPSFYEGLPLVLLEALASGCRLVVSDLPGCRELLAAFDSRQVAFLPLPPLASLDRPAAEDIGGLRRQLARTIAEMGSKILEKLESGVTPEIGGRFGWRAVFTRVEAAYARAMVG